MKKGLIIGCAVAAGLVLIGVIGCVGLFVFVGSQAGEGHATFYGAVSTGDPDSVIALCHADLIRQIDPPLLKHWMTVFNEHLGAYKEVSWNGIQSHTTWRNGVKVTESTATVEFEKGEVETEIVYHDGLIAGFHIQSESFPDNWMKGFEDVDLYVARGREFIETYFAGDPAATFETMHESLREVMPMAKLETEQSAFLEKTGALESASLSKTEFDGESVLKVHFDWQSEKGEGVGDVKFEFVDMKGHVLGYSLTQK